MFDADTEVEVSETKLPGIGLRHDFVTEDGRPILLDFGVPLLDENDQPISAEAATKSP